MLLLQEMKWDGSKYYHNFQVPYLQNASLFEVEFIASL